MKLVNFLNFYWGIGGSAVKESACQAGEVDSISGSARSSGKGMATCSNILAWEIPWTEEPRRL